MKNSEDSISVVVPIYNAESNLERCLNSIIAQEWKNLQIILVNDGSTDGSREICERYRQMDNRILVIHKENGGPAEARNTGIDKAQGKYIAFIDADDFVHKKYIRILHDKLVEYDADISICDYCRIKQESTFYVKKPIKQSKRSIVLSSKEMLENWHGRYKHLETVPWNKLYKRELFLKYNILFPSGEFAEDVQTIHLLVAVSTRIVIINQKLYFYNQRNGSLTHSISEDKIWGCIKSQKIRLKYFKEKGYVQAFERMNIKKQKYYVLAYYNIKKRDARFALRNEFLEYYNEVMNCQVITLREKIFFYIIKSIIS